MIERSKRELREAIAAKYSVSTGGGKTEVIINRAIRKLPGGNEVLDAIETTNAARNHAAKAGANDRIVAIDAAIDNLEDIREAMSRHVIESLDN